MASTKSRGLGRGLEALIIDTEIPAVEPDNGPSKDGVAYIDINEIKPNRNQPRKMFDADKLQELADSIQEHGVIQPLIVQTKPSSRSFSLTRITSVSSAQSFV